MRRSFLVFLTVLCAPVSAALQGPSFQSRKQAPRLPALTRLSGGGDAVATDGRGNGVDPAELADFVALHGFSKEEAFADKTHNQKYDPRELHQAGFLRTRAGTLFRSSFIVKQLLFLGLVASISGAIGWNFSDVHDMQYFEHLEDALHGIIIFFMGFFINKVYDRWFNLFSGPFGAIWGAINGCSFYGNQYLRGPKKSKILLQNLRWGLLSHALLFKDASGEAGVDDLLARQLCTPAEAAILADLEERSPGASRAKIPWAWVAESFTRADEEGRLHNGAHSLPLIHQKCTAATGGIGAINGSLGQKLPLPYVHLLTIMAKFNMGLMAVTRGMSVAAHVKYGLLSSSPQLDRLSASLFLVIDIARMTFLPLVYQGSFELHSLMWNPFNRKSLENPVRFPEKFYHWKILGESAALMSTPTTDAYPGVEA